VVRLKQEAVGEQVRRLREQQGLTLRALATATDFSPSFISQLENGLVSPSIASMQRIVGTLGVSLGDFFASLGSAEGGLVVRAAERLQLPSGWSQATVEALSPMRRNCVLEPLLISLESGGRSGKHPSAARREEFAYVVEGEVELTLGPDSSRLREGDAVTILQGELRRWVNDGKAPARILVIAAR
jgi:mannose-6-phosphate isomerase-like protein (cupin superfamily)/DNA-binding XRE family transcriptional regulator